MSNLALGLDCSGETYSVGLYGGRGISLEVNGFQPRKALREIPGAIAFLLKTAGATHADLAVVGLTQGPGSFTGVRLGVTVAKTVAFASGCKLCPWDTLELLARQTLPDSSQGTVAVALDARRSELYCGLFNKGSGDWQTLVPTGVRSADEFAAELAKAGPIHALIGTGFAAYPQLCPLAWSGPRYLTREESAPRGLVIARLSLVADARWVASEQLLPVYHREADIQVSSPR